MPDIPFSLDFGGRKLVLNIDQSQPVHRAIVHELQARAGYEKSTQDFIFRALRPSDTFVDIGAHIGYFSMVAAVAVGESGRVLAVEPTDENHRRLVEHFTVNELHWAVAEKCAISDQDGEVTFYLNADNDGGHALWDPSKHPDNERTRANPQTLTVPSMTLETLFARHDIRHVKLMKIDTEGAEPLVLKGAEKILSEGHVDFILAEVNVGGLSSFDYQVGEFFALCMDLGFILLLPDENGGEPRILTGRNIPDPRYVYNVILARPAGLRKL